MRRLRRLALAGAAVAALAATGCGGPAPAPRAHRAYVGVYQPGVPQSYQPVASFATATGIRPDIVSYYSGWYESFWASFAAQVHGHGGTLLVQIDPDGVDLAAVAAGAYDGYLASFARAARAYRQPVIIGFAHEMNGNWYSWGYTHTAPVVWVAAWRHVVDVFRAQGAGNVRWLWTIACAGSATGPLKDWWPGTNYVTWVGIDGYYYNGSSTFGSVFGPTIGAVRRITGKPILISEAGIGSSAYRAGQIRGLFAGVERRRLLGLVWFDVDQQGQPYGEDWQIEGQRAAVAAFRRAAMSVGARAS